MKNTLWMISSLCLVVLASIFQSCTSTPAPKPATTNTLTTAKVSNGCDKSGPATLYKDGALFADADAKDAYQLVANYWGGTTDVANKSTGHFKNEKRSYSASEGVINDLFDQATAAYKDNIALRVSNIENPAKAKIEWVACDDVFEQEIKEEACLTFFLIKRDLLFTKEDAAHDEATNPLGGIMGTQEKGLQVTKASGKKGVADELISPVAANAATARLAKSDKQYHVIVSPTYSHIINFAGGSGTHVSGTGIRLPPKD
jgi:hypothetical protein